MSKRKDYADARAEALRQAGEALGIDYLDADGEALDLVLAEAERRLRDWNIPVPAGWQLAVTEDGDPV